MIDTGLMLFLFCCNKIMRFDDIFSYKFMHVFPGDYYYISSALLPFFGHVYAILDILYIALEMEE